MSFIKNHWFGLFGSIVVFVFMCVFILVILSPRQDAQNRGFIPCTKQLAEKLLNCPQDSKIACLFNAIVKNTWCDMKVIGNGFWEWTKGSQKTPWSNYIFVPQDIRDETFDAETEAEYLKNNPLPTIEMQELQKLNEELENEIIREEVDEDEKPR